MTRGKILECTAAQSAWLSAGTCEGSGAFGAFCRDFGVPAPRTDEQSADRRRSVIYMAGNRLNNGRGEVFADAILRGPVLGAPGLVQDIPVSLKGGDSRDITTDIPWARAAVEAGMPLWCILLDGEAEAVQYEDGVRVDIPPARGLSMRRINITPLLRDLLETWEISESDDKVAFVRAHRVKSGGKVYTYPRLRVKWKRVPAHYWLDGEPVAWNPTAPLPSPYL